MDLLGKIKNREIDESTPAIHRPTEIALPLLAASTLPTPALAAGPVSDDERWAVDCPVGVWWHDPGKIALSYGELIRKPAVEPAICQPCLGDLFWEDIAGRMHCIECDRVPSLRMVKDFWRANSDGEKNAAGEWIATGWSRWFPKNDVLERLFAHLAAADQQRQAAAAAASGF